MDWSSFPIPPMRREARFGDRVVPVFCERPNSIWAMLEQAVAKNGDGEALICGDSRLSWRDVASRRNFWLLVGIYLPMLALNGGCAQNLAPYAASHGWTQESAGVLLSVLSFSHLIATFSLGLVSDRFGNRLPFAGLALIMAAGAAVFAFGGALVFIAGILIGSS